MPDADDAIWAAHDAGLSHPRHPAPLEDEPERRAPTEAERLSELHDRGFLDDAAYAAALAEVDVE